MNIYHHQWRRLTHQFLRRQGTKRGGGSETRDHGGERRVGGNETMGKQEGMVIDMFGEKGLNRSERREG